MKNLAHSLLSYLLPMGAGLLVWFYFAHIPELVRYEHLAFWFPERTSKKHHLIQADSENIITSKIDPEPQRFSCQQFTIDLETARAFRTNHLTAANWVYLLNRIRTRGSDSIIISTPLSWENEDEIALRALEHQLSNFRHTAVAIDLIETPRGSPFPPYLESSIIPYDGDLGKVPSVNHVVSPPSIQTQQYGFTEITPSTAHTLPLLAKWGEHLLPSLELAYLIARNNGEIKIELGKYIDCGVILPIDETGAYDLSSLEPSSTLSAAELLNGSPTMAGLTLITHENQGERFSQLSSIIAHQATRLPKSANEYRRLSYLEGIPLLLIFLICLHSRKMILILLCLVAPLGNTLYFKTWILLSPFIVTLLGYLLITKLQKIRNN